MKKPPFQCPHSNPEFPCCQGGCLPAALAAIMAEVSRQRIYVLMEKEAIHSHTIKGQKLVCVPSLMEWLHSPTREKAKKPKTKKPSQTVDPQRHTNGT